VRLAGERVGGPDGADVDPAARSAPFPDALTLGRACDDAGLPLVRGSVRDTGSRPSPTARLRKSDPHAAADDEHVRGVEAKADFVPGRRHPICCGADPEYDMGITGALKIAHLAESLRDRMSSCNACGPAHRHLMAASPQHQLLRAGAGRSPPRENRCRRSTPAGTADDLEAVGRTAVFHSEGPGLGVTYDWDFNRQESDQAA